MTDYLTDEIRVAIEMERQRDLRAVARGAMTVEAFAAKWPVAKPTNVVSMRDWLADNCG
jgi:hypothetical protein